MFTPPQRPRSPRYADRQQHQRDQGGKTETGRYHDYASAEGLDQQSEPQRGQRLSDARRRSDEPKPIGIVLRPEDGQRQRSARDREDAVAGAVQQGEGRCGAAAEQSDDTGTDRVRDAGEPG